MMKRHFIQDSGDCFGINKSTQLYRNFKITFAGGSVSVNLQITFTHILNHIGR